MYYAEVAVNAPGGHRATFSYAIPAGLSIQTGSAVWVPFGSRTVQGIVMRLCNMPAVEDVKPVLSVIGDSPVLNPAQVDLASWLSGYYICPLFDAVALFLPPYFLRRIETIYEIDTAVLSIIQTGLTADMQAAIQLALPKGRLTAAQMRKALGVKTAQKAAEGLTKLKIFRLTQTLQPPRVSAKLVEFASLSSDSVGPDRTKPAGLKHPSPRQSQLLAFLAASGTAVPVSGLLTACQAKRPLLKNLVKKGLIRLEKIRVRRNPLTRFDSREPPAPVLTPAQSSALDTISPSIRRKQEPGSRPAIFCLFGVTGSGKTEIYLRLLAEAVSHGKRAICLVPEISLTPQALERFHARFPGRVAVIHSHLSPGEQFDEWGLIQRGDFDVVIGSRSALFAPQPDLGLIVLDEEHEWTYKQADQSPRYHARTVAIEMARRVGATLVLGSATPDVETFHAAETGAFQLVQLPERVTPLGAFSIASVQLVDQRAELKAGNSGLFSRALENSIRDTLDNGEQAILFLNRRGTATFVACGACGFVARCSRCGIALTYHTADQLLLCHRCHQRRLAVRTCPSCHKPRLRFLGIGTEAVVTETARLFPSARLSRWDADSASGRHAHERILTDIRDRRTDILIGTQMLAKGLDLPGVTLAGIINADTGLNWPDFRSSERTFQLICQVAGRVGRGERPGRVIIQTYVPDYYAIRHAAHQDYRGFFADEIAWRRALGYPPFRQLIRLTYSHPNADHCHTEAEAVSRKLVIICEMQGLADINVTEALPAPVTRLRGRWRWQVTLAGTNPARLLDGFSLPEGWVIDVDPIGVL